MRTMDSMCGGHKYRPPLTPTSFYQPDIYSRPTTLRPQSEYRFAGGGSVVQGRGGSGKLCSAALVVAALLAALAVLAVAAMAFYMGALRHDSSDPIIAFEGSARVTRGDVYGGAPGGPAWKERARRYSAALRAIYSAPSLLKQAFAGTHVTGFGERRLDVYFRIYLDRRKIPSSVNNIEETLRDILIKDTQSRRSAFGQIKIDPTSIVFKRDLEHTYHSESYVKEAMNETGFNASPPETNKDKTLQTRLGVVKKTTIKPSVSKKKTAQDEPEINTENLPIVQGTFQITKTEADLTENKQINVPKINEKHTYKSSTHKPVTTKSSTTTTSKPKAFTASSTLKPKTEIPTTSTKHTIIKTTTAHSTIAVDNFTSNLNNGNSSEVIPEETTKKSHLQDLPQLDTLFNVPHVVLNDEPWRPITRQYDLESTTKEIENLPSQTAEDRMGVAEVVEDISSLEAMLNNTPLAPIDASKELLDSSATNAHSGNPSVPSDLFEPKPIYTSFSQPTLMPTLKDTETLGSGYLKPHPIPVDKISSIVEPNSHTANDDNDGKPIIRPPKEKLSSITINVLQPTLQEKTTDKIETANGSIVKLNNETTPETKIIEAESRIDTDADSLLLSDLEQETKVTDNAEPIKDVHIRRPNDKIPPAINSVQLTWELINSSNTNEPVIKTEPEQYYNETLQAIITKDDISNTTPKLFNKMSLLKNLTDLINKYTSSGGPKTAGNTELSRDTIVSEKYRRNDDLASQHKTSNKNSIGIKYATTTVSKVTTEIPTTIVTLLPAKSNLGVNRPLRPRPKNPIQVVHENERSFFRGKTEPLIIPKIDESITQPTISKPNFAQNIAETTSYVEIITSPNLLSDNTDITSNFFANVSESIKVVESSSNNISSQTNQPADFLQESNKSPSEIKEIYMPTEATGYKDINFDQTSAIVAEPKSIDTSKANSNNIPEGTYKILYHVSGSVSSSSSKSNKPVRTYELPLEPDITLEIPINRTNPLTADKLKQLASLATISDYSSSSFQPKENIISTKAVSSGYVLNQAGLEILTKVLNKNQKDQSIENSFYNENPITIKKESTPGIESEFCNLNTSFKCSSGHCLPISARCNRLLDCPDGEDERTCSCADYLRAERLDSKICDGVTDCWDFTDENSCEWCSPNQYVCANAKQCVEQKNVCDGNSDCPLGDDEKSCVTLAEKLENGPVVTYNEEGFVTVRKHGVWGRLCIDDFPDVIRESRSTLQLQDLGRAVCRGMTFEELEWAREEFEDPDDQSTQGYWKVWHNRQARVGDTRLSFRRTPCKRRRLLRVRCAMLECGLRLAADTQQPRYTQPDNAAYARIRRVVGGRGAAGGAWPWQAAMYRDGDFQCGATLIAPSWLISASHCFYQATEAHWVARVGALRRGAWPPGPWESAARVQRIVLHPQYAARGFRNDVALVRVPALGLHARMRPACLPPPRTEPPADNACTVLGWGQLFEVGRVFPDTLQEVELPVISTAECKRRTLFLPLYRVTDDMFCAGFERGGRDACLGDSGGPLVCQESDGRWYLHGVTSNGYGCARPNRPGVYTKVANYIDWIQDVIEEDEQGSRHNDIFKALYDSKKEIYDLDTAENGRSALFNDTCKGHRCPLGECLPHTSVCNRFLECSDGSDEDSCSAHSRNDSMLYP